MKKSIWPIFLAVAVSFSQDLQAASSSNGTIANLLVTESGLISFTAGLKSDKPTCASGEEWGWDIKTPNGKSLQVLALLAYTTGKKIHVYGSGNCDAWGTRESPAFIVVDD